VPLGHTSEPPAPPDDLEAPGRASWAHLWAAGSTWLHPDADWAAVGLACRLLDCVEVARARYRATTLPADARALVGCRRRTPGPCPAWTSTRRRAAGRASWRSGVSRSSSGWSHAAGTASVTNPLLIDLSPRLAGHVATAIRLHRDMLRRARMSAPDGLVDLEEMCDSRAREGQAGTPLADLWRATDDQRVTAQLLAEILGTTPTRPGTG